MMHAHEPKIARADYRVCRALLRRGSRSFAGAFRLLPRRLRPSVAAVYAFCRVADDLIERADFDERAVERLERRLEGIFGNVPADDPVDRAFAAVVAHYAIPAAVANALVEGFRWSHEGRRYRTVGELRAYAVRVASTAGLMVALVMGERRPAALARACDLGVAMQLTNIARDVGEDARVGRLYLPQDWLRARGIDPAQQLVPNPRFSPALGEVVEALLAEADRLYGRSESGIALLPPECREAIRAVRWIYADIGRALRERGCDSVSARAATSGARKVWLLFRASRRTPGECTGEGMFDPPLPEAAFLVEAVVSLMESRQSTVDSRQLRAGAEG